jgi:YfiH family protein
MMEAGGLNPMDMIRFNIFAPHTGLIHGIFTRRGGESGPPFDSLNVGLSTGDDVTHVRENRCRIARHLGFERALYLHQVHGNDVLVVARESQIAGLTSHGMATKSGPEVPDTYSHCPDNFSRQNGNPSAPLALPVADGVVTNIPGVLLVIQVADCQAVVLFDPVKQVVANLHSGWRGSVANIIGRGVDAMVTQFGSDPGNIRAGIGPSLGTCCAEFIHYKDELPQKFLKYRQGEHHFDFWAISRDQLMERGVQPDHIEVTGLCTQCHPNRFFSHRHEKSTGRFAVAAGLCL